MKKILLAAIIILSAGARSLNAKVSNAQPVASIHISYYEFKKDLASAD